jgi:hypothetical protein
LIGHCPEKVGTQTVKKEQKQSVQIPTHMGNKTITPDGDIQIPVFSLSDFGEPIKEQEEPKKEDPKEEQDEFANDYFS